AIYLARATPIYTATAQILLNPHRQGGADPYYSALFEFYDSSNLENQLTIITSDSLLRRVVIKERLAPPPPAAANAPQNTSQSPPDENATSTDARQVQDAVNRLRGALSVARVGASHAMNISVTWADPERAAQLANAIADAYIVDQLDTRFEGAKRASAWLSDRLAELRKQVRDSEEAVATFRKENGLVRTNA